MKRVGMWSGLICLLIIGSSFKKDDSIKFLMDAVDARLMDTEEGKLARERGTTEEIRSYGRWMMRDQSKLLEELRKLAAKKNVSLPKTISIKKSEGLEELKKYKGKEFDEKFTKMICIDHKRDVREFKKAARSKDEEIRAFASQYLPTIEAHLDRIREIEKGD